MAKRQELLLKSKPQIGIRKFDYNYIASLFGDQMTEEFKSEFAKKIDSLNGIPDSINLEKWDEIRGEIDQITIDTVKMKNIIKKAGLLSDIKELGWDKSIYKTACETARFTRNRFTFLDIEN